MTGHVLLLLALLRVHVMLDMLVILVRVMCVMDKLAVGLVNVMSIPMMLRVTSAIAMLVILELIAQAGLQIGFVPTDLSVNFETLLKQMVVMILIVIVVHVPSMVVLLYVHVTLVILGAPAQITFVMGKVAVGLVTVKSIQMIRKATSAPVILDIQGQIVNQTIA